MAVTREVGLRRWLPMVLLTVGAAPPEAPSIGLDVEGGLSATLMRGEVELSCIARSKPSERQTVFVPQESAFLASGASPSPEEEWRSTYEGVQQLVPLTCEKTRLDPVGKAAFVAGDGKRVALIVTRADGSKRRYNLGLTEGRTELLPLWNPTALGKRPLLAPGENRIAYTVRGAGEPRTGEVTLDIAVTGEATCEPTTLQGTDCAAVQEACQLYFARKPRCD